MKPSDNTAEKVRVWLSETYRALDELAGHRWPADTLGFLRKSHPGIKAEIDHANRMLDEGSNPSRAVVLLDLAWRKAYRAVNARGVVVQARDTETAG